MQLTYAQVKEEIELAKIPLQFTMFEVDAYGCKYKFNRKLILGEYIAFIEMHGIDFILGELVGILRDRRF